MKAADKRSKGVPPAVSFVAMSGTGKTTLIELVIRKMTERGYRIGAVKHSAHGFDIDHEGKDSWRLTRAGALTTVLSSDGRLALLKTSSEGEIPFREIIVRYMADVDLVIAEGYKSGGLAKIEVHRAELGRRFLCVSEDGGTIDPGFIAVVSDEDLPLPVPVFPLKDADALCDFLERRFLAGS